ITTRIFGFAGSMVGHLRGGLAHVNVVASIIFSGMTGSAIADASGLGLMEVKAM
ncbi:MAG: TRAP transporter large permease subunit, partial [Nitrospinaceae bacterium]|nr:TRAP transporter large permease subunit [Nitrospinaceae bacterium]